MSRLAMFLGTALLLVPGTGLAEVSTEGADFLNCQGRGVTRNTLQRGGLIALRERPDKASRKISELPDGQAAEICGRSNGWYAVRAPQGYGWASPRVFAEISSDPAQTAPAGQAANGAPPKPVPGTRNTPANGSSAPPASTAVKWCDALAAHPKDPSRRGVGVRGGSVLQEQAMLACSQAVTVSSDPVTLYQMGRVYDLAKNYPEALRYYFKASEKGHSHAAGAIASTVVETRSIPANAPGGPYRSWREFAEHYYRLAASRGNADGATGIGMIGFHYVNGLDGFPINLPYGLALLQEAARMGNRDAQMMLMQMAANTFQMFQGGSMDSEASGRQRMEDELPRLIEKRNQELRGSDN